MLLPETTKTSHLWIDGSFVPWSESTVHPITHGLHYGSCVFEGERAYNGHIFKSMEHTERLFRSAQILGMEIPFTPDDIEEAKAALLKDSGLKDAYLRAFVWRGGEAMGIWDKDCKTHVAVALWEWPSYFPPELREKGISLKTAKWKKPSPETAPVHAKAAGLYMIGTLSKEEAVKAGYTDALMLDYRGFVAEATGANLFMVKDGQIFTPTPDCFLNGITRLTVIDLAREAGLTVTEKHISYDELMGADEIFITGTAAEVTPIGKIDASSFSVGPVTRQLRDAYERLVGR
ncbi:MAG: branched-chain amino acid aminotransferase [Pseudobdellovibrionaceae bacterium]